MYARQCTILQRNKCVSSKRHYAQLAWLNLCFFLFFGLHTCAHDLENNTRSWNNMTLYQIDLRNDTSLLSIQSSKCLEENTKVTSKRLSFLLSLSCYGNVPKAPNCRQHQSFCRRLLLFLLLDLHKGKKEPLFS